MGGPTRGTNAGLINGAMRFVAMVLLLPCSAAALEIHAYTAGGFLILNGQVKVPASDLAGSLAMLKANNPSEIILAFPTDYPVEGDETVAWSKLWYRRELTKLSRGPDGWDLRSIRIIEAPGR